MPTGYTAAVQNGQITEFKDFAMQCARAMGACVTMRGQSFDEPIPERFEPSTDFHDRELAKARDMVDVLKNSDEETLQKLYSAEVDKTSEYNKNQQIQFDLELSRYQKMLAETKAWSPPTGEHEDLKKFMIQQLELSIPTSVFVIDTLPKSVEEWVAVEIERVEKDIDYHVKKLTEEILRTERRNRWIADLRSSLS